MGGGRGSGKGNGLRERVVAFDPGGTTGWCAMEYRRGAGRDGVLRWKTGSIGGGSDGDALVSVVRGMASVVLKFLPNGGTVVVEDFVLDKGRASGSRDLLAPVRLTAGLRVELAWLAGMGGLEGEGSGWRIELQSAADAKSVVTNKRLRSWGFWVRGSDHERDAVRHALLYVRRSGGP
jgi:hypothetical protein